MCVGRLLCGTGGVECLMRFATRNSDWGDLLLPNYLEYRSPRRAPLLYSRTLLGWRDITHTYLPWFGSRMQSIVTGSVRQSAKWLTNYTHLLGKSVRDTHHLTQNRSRVLGLELRAGKRSSWWCERFKKPFENDFFQNSRGIEQQVNSSYQ